MDELWNRVRALEGQTLRTVRGQPFVVTQVRRETVTVTPQSTNKTRSIQGAIIEDAWNLGLRVQEITPSALRDKVASDDQNLSYIAAILKALHRQ